MKIQTGLSEMTLERIKESGLEYDKTYKPRYSEAASIPFVVDGIEGEAILDEEEGLVEMTIMMTRDLTDTE